MIAAAMPRPFAASPLAALFAALSSRLGGDAEPLAEEAIARLVEQARAGDAGARQTLYMQHVDRVFRTVRGMLRSDADAEDVTQDAMLTVLTSLHKYTPRADARFAAWVTTIAVNTVRRRFRRRRPELTATGELPEMPDDGVDPADDLDRARQRRALLIALARAARARASDRQPALRRRAQRERNRRPPSASSPRRSARFSSARARVSARGSRHC